MPTRRTFLKTTAATSASAMLGLTVPAVHAAGSDEIRIALVGCGGRGSGAIRDRAQVGDNYKIVAAAAAFENDAKNCAARLRKDNEAENNPLKGKVDLPEDRTFAGLDAYKKAIDCLKPGDQVILATPPGFRPFHYRYAVEKGLHVFMEKPICIDAPGFKHVMETNKMADEKNLKIQVGFQLRYDKAPILEAVHGGKIGELLFTRSYYNGGGIWCKRREPGEDELHFQVRNWYHFTYLCGDNIAEQQCHTLDIANRLNSKGDRMAHPVEANAQGGRTVKCCPAELLRNAPPFSDRAEWDKWYQANKAAFYRHGQAWDHFFIEYTYGTGAKVFAQSRHIKNCWVSANEECAHGTKGTALAKWHKGSGVWDLSGNPIAGEYNAKLPKGSISWEHDVHVKAIRENLPMNEAYAGAMSCMMAVLGREAAFSGKVIKWDDLVAKGRPYWTNGEITDWTQLPPVKPDADGFYEGSVPVPGVYNPFA